MSNLTWIKLAIGMFDDEKIKIIESMPDGDAIITIWTKLLLLAGKVNDGGYIYIAKGMPYSDETLSTVLSRPINTVRLALDIFKKFNMVAIDNNGAGGCHYLVNWEKWQNVEGMDRIRELTRHRVANFRERQKQLPLGSNDDVTLQKRYSNATDKNREDKNREEEKEEEGRLSVQNYRREEYQKKARELGRDLYADELHELDQRVNEYEAQNAAP